jgi:hypothetical protein
VVSLYDESGDGNAGKGSSLYGDSGDTLWVCSCHLGIVWMLCTMQVEDRRV